MATCPDPRTCPIGCRDCADHLQTCEACDCETCDRIIEADTLLLTVWLD